jgi:predicted O-linked N-acetylglucosamine transferase (SPINDLY family)
MYDDMEQVGRWREVHPQPAELACTLTLETEEQRVFAIEAIRHHVNFYLGYQRQDDRELQREYGRPVHRVVAAQCSANGLDWLAVPREPATQEPRNRIRVGYISIRIATSTSVSKPFGGWILNRDRHPFGLNTTMDAVAAGLRVVTLPGEYVELAIRLGNEASGRQQVVKKMAERQTRLYSDISSVTALESFLVEVVPTEAAKVGKTWTGP